MRHRPERETDEGSADHQAHHANTQNADEGQLQRRSCRQAGDHRGPGVGEADDGHQQHQSGARDEEHRRIAPLAPRHHGEHRGADEQPGEDHDVGNPDDQVARACRPLLALPLFRHEHVRPRRNDLVAGNPDVDARFALRQRRDGRVDEGERPVGARLQLRGTRRHFPDLSACRVEAEPFGDSLDGERPRGAFVERRAGAIFRHDVAGAQNPAVRRDQHGPFFGPIDDVAFEGRYADRPAGRGQVRADQLTPPRFAGRLRDEFVRAVAAVERQRHHAPLPIERHPTLGQRAPRRRLGVLTRGRQSRRVGPQASRHDRNQRDRPDRQPCHAGAWSDGRPRRFEDDGIAFERDRRGPRGVAIGRRELRPAPDLRAPGEHDPQRDEDEQRDHRLLDPDTRGVREQDGNREQHDVERVVQDDCRQEAVVEVEQTEANRREEQFHRPCVRRLGGILGMAGAEYQRPGR